MGTRSHEVNGQAEGVLRRAFNAYNRQDAEALLDMVSADVRWPVDGGRILGKTDLLAFWRSQWAQTRTHDEVTLIEQTGSTQFVVSLDQVVRSVEGVKLSEGSFRYGFTIDNGLISHLSSREPITPHEVRS